jgi:hypothetical protein
VKALVGFSGRTPTAERPKHINGQNGVPKAYRVTTGREVVSTPNTEIIKNKGPLRKHVLIGELTLGIIRYEWHIHRASQIIPINFQMGTVMASHAPATHAAMNYSTPDAQNVVLERAILDKYEWLMYWEDDVLPPFDALLKMNVHMEKMTAPILSGLYFTKGNPSWPLVFRGRGNGAWFKGWEVGDRVWADGVPTGFILIHRSIFEWLWKNSPEYRLPDGRLMRRAFEFPRKTWFDPEQDRYFTEMGTSDLTMCDRILKNDVLRKTGWTALAKQKYPFLVDTSIFCGHIDLQSGQVYPQSAREVLWPKR